MHGSSTPDPAAGGLEALASGYAGQADEAERRAATVRNVLLGGAQQAPLRGSTHSPP
ncbi:MAG TPA: hypothetical protein VMS76_18130 [Planctomycetota bacterium]|nr:hypothetical protein [Planctomycetota bacterium]